MLQNTWVWYQRVRLNVVHSQAYEGHPRPHDRGYRALGNIQTGLELGIGYAAALIE